jgi:hypothetical protein
MTFKLYSSTTRRQNLRHLPPVDMTRFSAVYVRQSDKDAETDHVESREMQIALVEWVKALRGDDKVLLYDEGAGISGQKALHQRKELLRLYGDVKRGIIGSIFVTRPDRVARDKHQETVNELIKTFEKHRIILYVYDGEDASCYDFLEWEDQKAFREAMERAYDYIVYQVGYMNKASANKARKGLYDGRGLPPGLVVEKETPVKQCRPVIFEKWAERTRWLHSRLRELSYDFSALRREVESMPYVYPAPSQEDYRKYIIKTNLQPVYRDGELVGYRFSTRHGLLETILNPMFIGYWKVSEDTGEKDEEGRPIKEAYYIPDNHPSLLEKEGFEQALIHLTGYNLAGEAVRKNVPRRRQNRRGEDQVPALLRYVLQSPDGLVYPVPDRHNLYCYRAHASWEAMQAEGKMLRDMIWSLRCRDLDIIVVERLIALAARDVNIADRVREALIEVHGSQQGQADALRNMISNVEAERKHLLSTLKNVGSVLDAESQKELAADIAGKAHRIQQLQRELDSLPQPASLEEIEQLYETLAGLPGKWEGRTLRQKQRIVQLLVSKAELASLSSHWFRLTIHWHTAISPRPDVALVWRQNTKRREGSWEQWEVDILREVYPFIHKYSDILPLLPKRTYKAIIARANRLGYIRRNGHAKGDVSETVAWEDIQLIQQDGGTTLQEAMDFVQRADAEVNRGRSLYAAWCFGLGPDDLAMDICKLHGGCDQPDRSL